MSYTLHLCLSIRFAYVLNAAHLLLVGGLHRFGLIDESELTLVFVVVVGVLADVAHRELRLILLVLLVHVRIVGPIGNLLFLLFVFVQVIVYTVLKNI